METIFCSPCLYNFCYCSQFQAISEIPSRPSAIIALVQKEQERISRNLESLKMRRTPRLQTPLSSRATRTPKNDLYKRSLVLREANRISQFLKKNTVRATKCSYTADIISISMMLFFSFWMFILNS